MKHERMESKKFEKNLKKKRQKLLKLKPILKACVADALKVEELNGASTSNTASEARPALSTVTIAVPGSILDNAQSAALRAYLAGQIARAACIYKVTEVVVFDDVIEIGNESHEKEKINNVSVRRCCTQLARILQYLECPQYLRKHIFPMHEDLEFAGILNPLDSPHHLRQNDEFVFREGIVTQRPGTKSYVNVGLHKDVLVDRFLTPGLRVTVKLLPNTPGSKKVRGVIVSPLAPQMETGSYWGYSVRIANSISQVFSQCPFKGGYDLTIGTSDKGISIDELSPVDLPRYSRALIVFGGLQGLEQAVESDPLQVADDPSLLFNYYINSCPEQGSRTIRTEEAILITLAEIRKKFIPKHTFKTN